MTSSGVSFEPVIAREELGNAFSELNDPLDQESRFLEMGRDYGADDEERHPMDEDYLLAMEYGMPPISGWGMGIDRFIMLLTRGPTDPSTRVEFTDWAAVESAATHGLACAARAGDGGLYGEMVQNRVWHRRVELYVGSLPGTRSEGGLVHHAVDLSGPLENH